MPPLGPLYPFTAVGQGAAVVLVLEGHEQAAEGDVLLDSRGAQGQGLLVAVGAQASVVVNVSDGRAHGSLATGADCTQLLQQPGRHVLGIVLDAGPLVLTMMVDGLLCDGGGVQPAGWTWLPPLGSLAGSTSAKVAPSYHGHVVAGTIYPAMLRTSELVAAYRYYSQQPPRVEDV